MIESFAGLQRAVRRRLGTGVDIANPRLAAFGAMNRTVVFDVVESSGSRRTLVSREETLSQDINPFLPPTTQYRILQLVHRAGVPVPEPIFEFDDVDELGHGFVTAFVAGETLPRRLLADTSNHQGIVLGLAQAIARLHQLDPSDFPFLASVPESGDPIATMRMRIDALEQPHPALELGLRWLERNGNQHARRALVHGDLRNGNLMIDGPHLAALLDWECAHLSSPAEDLGWLCTRSWRFGAVEKHAGGFATRKEMLAAYQAAGGASISEDEVRWWEVFGLVRWAMSNVLQAYSHMKGRKSPAFAACGRNAAMIEYDLLMTLKGVYD